MKNFACICLAVSTTVCTALPLTLHAQSGPSFEFFQPSQNNGAPGSASGDFNQDGKLDVLSYTTLALGNGDGTFRAPTSIGSTRGGLLQDVAVGDVNGDGHLDVVIVEEGSNLSTNYVNVFFGNGDGTFQPAVSFATAYYPRTVAVGDFTGDGLLDIAVGDLQGAVEIFKNVGGKSFVAGTPVKVTSAPNEVAMVRAGDIDANGTVDLAVTTNTTAFVLWGDGKGNFSPVQLGSYNVLQGTIGLNVGDLNQDGNQDIILWFDCGQPPPAGHSFGVPCTDVEVYYGQGNRTTFHRQAVLDGVNDTVDLWPVDINGDGIGDLVGQVVANGTVQLGLGVYLGHPDGSFDQTPTILNGAGGNIPGDYNRDGKIDFAGIGEVALNATPTAACATSQISPTVTVCAPVNNTYQLSPFKIQATTDDRMTVTALQEYLDGKLVYNQPVKTFQITETAGLGSHLLVTKAWDASGVSFRSNRTINVFTGTPGQTCAAALDTANLCLPNGSTNTSPVHVLANAATRAVPTAVQLYVDNQLVINYTQGYTTAIDQSLALSPGSHYLVFKMFDATGASYSAAKTVTVQ